MLDFLFLLKILSQHMKSVENPTPEQRLCSDLRRKNIPWEQRPSYCAPEIYQNFK